MPISIEDLDRLTPDPDAPRPLQRQIYDGVRGGILAGTLKPGVRLPATRNLAKRWGVARITVTAAFEQLAVEGYLEARRGAGTFIAEDLPDSAPDRRRTFARPMGAMGAAAGLSRRGERLTHSHGWLVRARDGVFAPGRPDLASFPHEIWRRMEARSGREWARAVLAATDAAGWPPLREAIAAYIGAARGVIAEAAQVVIVPSSRQALQMAAVATADPGDAIALENPGYPGAHLAVALAGLTPLPVPVDDEGLCLDRLPTLPRARLIHVTPSHQYPSGATLSLARRMALIELARRRGAWIVEDDYDGEYRYDGRPLTALQGLDPDNVIYIGTFGKVLFPGLRLAYMVLPPRLLPIVLAARLGMDGHPAAPIQATMAGFMAEGHFGAHIRRTRRLYQARRQALAESLEKAFGAALTVRNAPAGMHLTLPLPARIDDTALVEALAVEGLAPAAISRCYLGPPRGNGLMLGYAGRPADALRDGVAVLARHLEPAEAA